MKGFYEMGSYEGFGKENKMKIAMGNDHSAVEMKNIIGEYLKEKGYEVVDFGTNSNDSCD